MEKYIRVVFLMSSVLIAFFTAEFFLKYFFPQKNIYLYEYTDGIIYNKPNFNGVFSFLPRRLPKESLDFRAFLKAGLSEEEKAKIDAIIGERKREQLSKELQINSSGERDDIDHAYEKNGKFRIVNLGDSIGFGWPVDLKDSYGKIIERKNNNLEVVNCSLMNASTPMLLEIYKKKCSQYDPDFVILQMTIAKEGANPDFMFLDKFGPDVIAGGIVGRDGGWNLLWDKVFKGSHGEVILDKKAINNFDDIAKKSLLPRLPLYDDLHVVRLVENSFTKMEKRSISHFALGPVFGVNPQESSIQQSLFYLEELRKELEANGAKLLVIMVPNLDGFYFSKVRERTDWGDFKKKLREMQYDFLDFSEIFKDHDPDEIYIYNEFHPNERGYYLIGDMITRYLEEGMIIENGR